MICGECETLRQECESLQLTFDMQWRADQRAIKLWQAAHPGNDMMWPDRCDMVVWLMEQYSAHAQCAPRHVEALEVCKVGFQNLVSITERTDIEIRDVCLQKIDWALCSDCPPIGYSTDKTRCDPCPRRDTALTSTER